MQNKQQVDRLKPNCKNNHNKCKWSKFPKLKSDCIKSNTQLTNTNHHKAGVVILKSDKVGFGAKNITKGKEDFS